MIFRQERKFPHSVIPQRWSILRQLIFQLAPKSNSHILYMPDWRIPTCLGMASEGLGLHTREALESLLNLALQALTGAARLSFTARIEGAISLSLPVSGEAAGVVSIARIERPSSS